MDEAREEVEIEPVDWPKGLFRDWQPATAHPGIFADPWCAPKVAPNCSSVKSLQRAEGVMPSLLTEATRTRWAAPPKGRRGLGVVYHGFRCCRPRPATDRVHRGGAPSSSDWEMSVVDSAQSSPGWMVLTGTPSG